MILREFDFFSDGNREVTTNLRRQTRFICSLYERCFPEKLQTDGVWKLETRIVSKSLLEQSVWVVGGVAVVEVEGNPAELLEILPAAKRHRLFLNLLRGAALRACEAMNWSKQPFMDAYECVLEKEFRNEWIWKGRKWSPNRKHRAEIRCEHRMDSAQLRLQVRDRNDEVRELSTIETLPSEFAFVPYLGELKWIPDDRLRWLSKDGTTVWEGKVN